MEAEPIFDVAGAMEATLHQRLDPLLTGRTSERGEERIPFRLDFRIGWQTRNVDKTLGLCDRLLVERRDAHGEGIDKGIELRVRKRAIDVAVTFGEIAMDVLGAEQYF